MDVPVIARSTRRSVEMSPTSGAVWFSSTRFFSRERARKFLPELGLVLKKKWKNINAVFFEIVLTSHTRKTSQGKRRPGLPRDRLCRSNGERLEPKLSQTSQNASMRRCHPFFFLFHYPLVKFKFKFKFLVQIGIAKTVTRWFL